MIPLILFMMETRMRVEYHISYNTFADTTTVSTQSVQYLISVREFVNLPEHLKPVSSFKSGLKTVLFAAGFSWTISLFSCL